jgi:hypothetical protein
MKLIKDASEIPNAMLQDLVFIHVNTDPNGATVTFRRKDGREEVYRFESFIDLKIGK